jgi:alpha-beta hydrolase superfamily lysophospholipase
MSDGVIHRVAPASFEGLRAITGEPAPARPLWFGARRQELFGQYHEPAAVSGELAVLLCNPFGYEAMCTHRAYLHLARALARRGLPVLRFDYHGCGDSSGDDRDPARLAAWRDSIHAAIDELKRLSGCAHVGLFGLRLGANLALDAASTRDDVTALALWAPFATGRTFLREELAVHKLRALDPRFDRPDTRAAGEIEALGFAITAETLASIEGLRVADLTRLPAKSALVLWRETLLQEQRVADKLKELGSAVVVAAASGYGEMLKGNVTPEQTWNEIGDYFARVRDEAGGAASARDVTPPRQASAEVYDSARADTPVRERAAYFGADERLFGVVSYADASLQSLDKPAILLLSGGVNHHVGQNRMYTRWARRWAAQGYDCFRFDLAGFGDSGAAHGGDAERDGELHSPENVDDVRAAIDFMSLECGSRSFALIGLCSGALQAFHAALDDARIASLGLLNWTRFLLDPSTVAAAAESGIRDLGSTEHHRRYQSLRYYVQMAADRDVWRRLLHGEVDARGIIEHFVRRTLGRARSELIHRLSLYGKTTPHTQLARDFERLAKRGVTTCVVYNGDEPILDVFREQLGPHLGRMMQARVTRLELIDGTDHVFTPLWSQEHVFELMSKHVLGQ